MHSILFEILRLTGIMVIAGSCSGNPDKDLISPDKDLISVVEKPEVPRINSVGINELQPQEKDAAVIWYDDFDDEKQYMESSGPIDNVEFFGATGGSMWCGFTKGEVSGKGNRKVAFGDFPGRSPIIAQGQHFDEVYWRMYVKYEYGWEGAPAKMSRATSIVSEKWQQAMICHVWSSANNTITLDPASGVFGLTDSIQTTKYNDFDNLRWLGNKPTSKFQITSTSESGYWILVEASTKLNTPGQSDGTCKLWIDGRLEAERTNMNFVGSYTKHGINAVFLESYWNSGAIKTEGRWFDNFVVSTKPVGPVTCPVNPALYRTPYHGPENIEAWKVEIATDYDGKDIVFKSVNLGTEEKTIINADKGTFTGSLAGNTQLVPGTSYFCRICQKSTNGEWSLWSRWHQPFKVEAN